MRSRIVTCKIDHPPRGLPWLAALPVLAVLPIASVVAGEPAAASLKIVPRAEWADRAPIKDRLKRHEPRFLTIHHAGVNDDGTVEGHEKMRRLLSFSLDKKPWGDVPYHFVIDQQGKVFAGRDLQYAPDTNTGYDVDGHIGVCVNGDLTRQPLLECQYKALIALLAKLTLELKIPDKRIAGHMDHSPEKTACPGALEHYIRDGALIAELQATRASHPVVFQLKTYDAKLLTRPRAGRAAPRPEPRDPSYAQERS